MNTCDENNKININESKDTLNNDGLENTEVITSNEDLIQNTTMSWTTDKDEMDNIQLRHRSGDNESISKPTPNLQSRPSFKKDHIDAHYDTLHWVLAAAGRILGLQFAPINIPIHRRLETFAALFWMSTFLFMGFGSLIFVLYLFFYTSFWWFSAVYFVYLLYDHKICEQGGRRYQAAREWALWRHFANFFPARIVKTTSYDTSKNYIFGYHPHGVLSAGAMAHFGTEGSGFSKIFPGLTPHLLVLGGHFYLPFYREFFMCSGGVSASKRSMEYLLTSGVGRALCLVVGGAPESLDAHPGTCTLHLSKRMGFCKIALRTGAQLVPTFSFGENSVYDQVRNPPGSLVRRVQDALQRVIGLAPVAFMGRGVFQYSFGIVPFRRPINTVFGPPLAVSQVENPTRGEVQQLHDRYIEALKKLYDEYKHFYAQEPDTPMTIV